MEDYIYQFEIINFVTGMLIGLVFGIVIGLLIKPGRHNTQKAVSLLMFGVWITGHTFGFLLNRDMPFLFDFMGSASVGTLIGVNVVDSLKEYAGKRK